LLPDPVSVPASGIGTGRSGIGTGRSGIGTGRSGIGTGNPVSVPANPVSVPADPVSDFNELYCTQGGGYSLYPSHMLLNDRYLVDLLLSCPDRPVDRAAGCRCKGQEFDTRLNTSNMSC
jgi:hypothetical protein